MKKYMGELAKYHILLAGHLCNSLDYRVYMYINPNNFFRLLVV